MLLISGCSNRGLYETVRETNRHQCMRLPETERERCLKDVDVDYEDYQRRREELDPDSSTDTPEPGQTDAGSPPAGEVNENSPNSP